jgi:5-methylcytosine-specific restriction endonuclease McrA
VCAAYRERHREDLAAKRRLYKAAHPEHRRAEQQRRYAAHREERLERAATYRVNHREEQRACSAAYAAAHREERLAYAAAHLEECARRVAAYRARLRSVPGSHTVADVAAQRTRQKGRCYYCGEKVGRHYHVDHVVPLSREGSSNDSSNLVITCHSCNESKRDRLPHEWAKSGRLC